MNSIVYPSDRKQLHKKYRELFTPNVISKADAWLKKIKFNNQPLSLEKLVTLSVKDLIILEKKTNLNHKKGSRGLLNYKGTQPKLANFFMNNSKINLRSCYYCSIDYINSFKDFPDFVKGLDFANHADLYELQYIEGVDKVAAQKIITKRLTKKFVSYKEIPVVTLIQDAFRDLPKDKTHNHFTLDHLFPQKDYPLFALCLYNLIPSCYSCNSKFKKEINFLNDKTLPKVSPSSDKYSFTDAFSFELYFKKHVDKVQTESDFEVRKKVNADLEQVNLYLRMFKIMGRYAAHKGEVLNLVRKKQQYPESRIRELSRETGLPKSEIKKMVFGEELFEDKYLGEPLVKFKRDIARNIKILAMPKK